MSLLDATFGRFPGAGCEGADATGNDLPYAPPYKANFGAEYAVPVSSLSAALSILGDWFYTDDYYTHASNVTSQPLANGSRVPFGRVDGYHLLSGKIAMVSEKKGWSVFLWAKNLTDEKYITSSDREFIGAIIVGRGVQRMYGLGISFLY